MIHVWLITIDIRSAMYMQIGNDACNMHTIAQSIIAIRAVNLDLCSEMVMLWFTFYVIYHFQLILQLIKYVLINAGFWISNNSQAWKTSLNWPLRVYDEGTITGLHLGIKTLASMRVITVRIAALKQIFHTVETTVNNLCISRPPSEA